MQFCVGYQVDKEKLALIEGRPLSKSNDGSYVKELAMLVFGAKALYNSSLSERKYSKAADKEDKVPRPKLNSTVLKEITSKYIFVSDFCQYSAFLKTLFIDKLLLADRLHKRVCKEKPSGAPPTDQHQRFKTSTVTKFIGDKIKKMRRNPNLKNLEDLQWQSEKLIKEQILDQNATEAVEETLFD